MLSFGRFTKNNLSSCFGRRSNTRYVLYVLRPEREVLGVGVSLKGLVCVLDWDKLET